MSAAKSGRAKPRRKAATPSLSSDGSLTMSKHAWAVCHGRAQFVLKEFRVASGLASGMDKIFSTMLVSAEEEYAAACKAASNAENNRRYESAHRRVRDLRCWSAIAFSVRAQIDLAEGHLRDVADHIGVRGRQAGDA